MSKWHMRSTLYLLIFFVVFLAFYTIEQQVAKADIMVKRLQLQTGEVGRKLESERQRFIALQNKLESLEDEETQNLEYLKNHKRRISDILGSLVIMGHVPRMAIFAMPDDVGDIGKDSEILSIIYQSIEKKMSEYQKRLAKVRKFKRDISVQKASLLKKSKKLQVIIDSLEGKIAKRQTLLHGLEAERFARYKKKSKAHASNSRNVGQLIGKFSNNSGRKSGSRRGRSKLMKPASGKIITKYGDKKSRNETSKGLVILTPNLAHVYASDDGEVLFSGPFLDYGKIIIIGHKGGHHSLLAGLSRIDVETGQRVVKGEPVGKMGKKNKNQLYVELRKSNKTIDPATWF